MNKILIFALQLIVLASLAFGVHCIFQQVLGVSNNWKDTGYSLFLIYIFELILSLIMILVLVGTSKSFLSNLGFIFLALLTFKCIGNYFFIQPVLDVQNSNNFIKHNFLIVFVIFLIFDVYVTYRILNQENKK